MTPAERVHREIQIALTLMSGTPVPPGTTYEEARARANWILDQVGVDSDFTETLYHQAVERAEFDDKLAAFVGGEPVR